MINLKAYRFNSEELIAINQLKDLFEGNGYILERFPEVYYDDYETLPFKINHETQEEDTPDYLAVYFYDYISDNSQLTIEGKIILFKDRIEDFAYRKEISVDDVRYIVLMHEFGHWLCHWPICNNNNWSFGFAVKNKKTKESLAQLIAYWMVDGKKNKEAILNEYLTPKNKTNPYYLYNNLKDKSKSEMLDKIISLRENYFLSDESMYQFLLEKEKNTMFEFLISFFYNEIKMFDKNTKLFNDSDFPASTRDYSEEIFLLDNEVSPITFDDLFLLKLERTLKSKDEIGKFDTGTGLLERIEYFYEINDSYYQELVDLFNKYRGSITGDKYGL
jgi:hypothetical protein